LLHAAVGRLANDADVDTGVLPLIATSSTMLESATKELVSWIQTDLDGHQPAEIVAAITVSDPPHCQPIGTARHPSRQQRIHRRPIRTHGIPVSRSVATHNS
jgi:hypothetical protein